MAPLAPPFPLPPEGLAVAGILLLIAGLVLAFFGRAIVRSLLALLGGLIGGALGLLAGAILGLGAGPLGGLLLALLLSFVGAAVGAALFGLLVKAGLAALVGLLAAGLLYSQVPSYVLAILVFVVVFAVAFYFVEELMGILTALVGGVLAGLGLYLLTGTPEVALLVGAAMALGGAAVQTLALPRYHRPAQARPP